MNDKLFMKALYKKNINGEEQISLNPELLRQILDSEELTERWGVLLTQDLFDWFEQAVHAAIVRRQEALNPEGKGTRKFPLETVFNDENK